MTLTIDTDKKIITLLDKVNINKLIETLEILGLKNEEWSIVPKIESIPKKIERNCPSPWKENSWPNPFIQPKVNPYK